MEQEYAYVYLRTTCLSASCLRFSLTSNIATPAPDPKKLTDDELKKYGIHVASRLEEEDVQGQSKWADIDEDDEDWTPDAITWTDGTKTTLPHTDEAHPPRPEPDQPESGLDKESDKPKSPVPPVSAASPQPRSGGLPSGKGLVLKASTPEKPTLVAKPPAPQQPAKSPWATLPPVERASPASHEPPASFSRGHPKEPIPPRGMGVPPLHPREIAADDFSRAPWREGASHGNRELYNSQSGRYEPVPDRRGSFRGDQAKHHPSVLQRPSAADQPAEPSSAFQTHRSSQDGHFGRRRGSSNVSGGSGSFYQRLGKGVDGHMPPPDFPGARRASHAGSAESPVSPAAVPAHQGMHPQPAPPGGPSPGKTFANLPQPGPGGPSGPNMAPAPHAPAPQTMDDVEYQKKLMRERTELARKRRQEQEAAEEAAKRERIQKKLEAMGPPPQKKNEKPESSPAAPEPIRPTQIQQRVAVDQSDAPAQPPVATRPDGNKADRRVSDQRPHPQPDHGLPQPSAPRRLSQGHDSRQNLWSGARSDRLGGWAPGAPPPLRNVWGSPNNDRGLGNGTFNPDLGLLPSSSVSQPQTGKGPAPIAPPGASREPSRGRQPQPPPPIGSRPHRYGQPGSELAAKWSGSVAENDKVLSAERLAESVEQEHQLAARGMTIDDAQPSIKDTWRPVNVGADGSRLPLSAMEPPVPGRGWKAHGDELAAMDHVQDIQGSSSRAGAIGTGGNSVLPQPGQAPSSQGRTSRFFPARDARLDGINVSSYRATSPTPPPPTMEDHPVYEGSAAHPHVSLPKPQPVVKLPPAMEEAQPQPQPARNASFSWASPAPYKDTPRGSVQHKQGRRSGDTTQRDWQKRFDNLLNNGKQHPPPKHMGVDPSSKSALDYAIPKNAATVSLPSHLPADVSPDVRASTSKSMAEECFDEPEMGSLPLVKFPHAVPDAAWQPIEAPTKPFPKKFTVQAVATESYRFPETFNGSNTLKIHFPGMGASKTVTLPSPSSHGRGSRGSHGKPSRNHRGSRRSSDKRDASRPREGAGSSHGGRRGRGGHRKGSENVNRNSPPRSSAQA